MSTWAQDETNSTGGAVANSEAMISYSVGTIFYRHSENVDAKFGCGVQHAYLEDLSTSASDVEGIALQVFPNPFDDLVQVQINTQSTEGVQYKLEDAAGRVVLVGNVLSANIQISTSNLSAGIYVIHLYKDNKQLEAIKLIKK